MRRAAPQAGVLLLVLLACAPRVSAGIEDTASLRIAVASFDGAEERAETLRVWLHGEGLPATVVDEARAAGGGLEALDLLVVPRSRDLPVSYWRLLPPRHAEGLDLLFEGVPLRTGHNGAEKFVPGLGPDLHLYFETGELPGLPKRGRVELRAAEPRLPAIADLPRRVGVAGGGTRSIQAWVHRYSRDTTGNRAYREDLRRVPFGFFTDDGKLLAQQAVLVRHHCRVFDGATTGFVDVTHPDRRGHTLLEGRGAATVLAGLVRQMSAPFPEERGADDYAQLSRLKEALESLRTDLVRAEYAWRDLALLARHAEAPTAAALEAELARNLPAALAILDAYHEARAGPPDAAWRRYPELAARAEKRARVLTSLADRLAAGVRDARAAAPRARAPLPGAELVYGFASTPVRWGFRDGPLLDAMQRAGMESYTDWAFDAQVLAARGGPRVSLYEFMKSLPPVKEAPWARTRTHTAVDLATGRSRTSSRQVPVFDPVYVSPEYDAWLAQKAEEHAEEPWINSRVVTIERVLRQEDAHGPHIQSPYRAFLKRRHGSIDVLNRRWGTRHTGFDTIHSPVRFPSNRGERANWFDFVDFRAEAVTGYVARVADAYRAADDRHAIVGSLNQQGPLSGVDFFALSGVLDRVSSHNWPTSLPWYNPGLAARRGQRGENNELKATRAGYGWTPKSERGHQWRARFYTLYTWARGVVEQEEHHWGLLGSGRTGERGSGLFGEVDGFVRLPGAEVAALNRGKPAWEGFAGATPPHESAQVGLYWSFATKSQGRGVPAVLRLGDDSFVNAFLLANLWNGWLDAIHVAFETVPRQKVKRGAIDHLRLIIVPQAPYLEHEVMAGLLAWVERGGHLLIVGRAGLYDEYAALVDGLLAPIGLRAGAAPDAPIRWRGGRLPAPRLHAPHNGGQVRLRIDGPGEALAKDTEGRPVARAVPVGRGLVTALGFAPPLDRRVAAGSLPATDASLAFFEEILERAGVRRAAWGATPQDRIAVWLGADGWHYAVLQNFSAERRDVALTIRGTAAPVVDVALGLPLRTERVGSDTQVVVPLIEGDGRVLAWRSSPR